LLKEVTSKRLFFLQAKGEAPPVSFHEPLLLREFFFTMASANPGLHKMDNNPMSVQYPWEENAEGLQRWKNVSASCGKCALLPFWVVNNFWGEFKTVFERLVSLSGYHWISMD